MRHTITAVALAACLMSIGPASIAGVIDGGSRHTCALDSAGLAWCWGGDDVGQQGSGLLINHSATPVQVSGLHVYKEISSGGGHSCALGASGEVRCWGENGNGQLGDGTYLDRNEPVVVPAYSATVIAAGAIATCGIGLDGLVSCWGRGAIAAPGLFLNDPNAPMPIAIPGAQTFKSVAVGESHACAVDTAGQAWCWGHNPRGQLGTGTSGEMDIAPVAVQQPGLVKFDSIVAGKSHTCAIDTAGGTWCWGAGDSRQLGQGSVDIPLPNQVVLAEGVSLQQLTAGDVHTCGIDQTGRVWCWGGNPTGAVGNPASRVLLFEPTRASLPQHLIFESIGSGERSTCAKTKQGEVWCWGDGMRGELGLGYFGHAPVPILLNESEGASSLTSGAYSSCRIDSAGAVECWGLNHVGQLGRGNTEDAVLPVRIDDSALPAGTTFAQVEAGDFHVCALDDDGKPWCWGTNANGQLGTGTSGPDQLSPAASAVPQSTAFTRLSAGGYHTCAIDLFEQLWCWGSNGSGQLGIGSGPDEQDPTPQPIMDFGQLAFSDVSAGANHTCAVEKTNGSIYCWGANGSGQLGQGDTTDRDVPTILPFVGNIGFSRVVAGGRTTCAAQAIPNATDKSQLWCWGENENGQLGDGTTTDRLVPVDAGLVNGSGDTMKPSYIALATGHTCARRPNGATACWGNNMLGQLGDGTTQNRLSSVITLFEDGQIEEIAAGFEHTCTLNTLGQLACAGSRRYGQLADDTMGHLVPPKAIPQFVAFFTTLFADGFE